MKLAILQPNFFPPKSYYDLVQKMDKVIFLDDVFYNNKSWVNKTLLKVKSKDYYFRVPINNLDDGERSQIKEIKIKEGEKWKRHFIKMVHLEHNDCYNYPAAINLVKSIIQLPVDNVCHLSAYSVFRVCSALGCDTEFSFSSVKYGNIKGSVESKILNICKKEGATTYYSLYKNNLNKNIFLKNGINLSHFVSYESKYSFIDSLMNTRSYYPLLKKECNLFQNERT
jgi:hypothetical protein